MSITASAVRFGVIQSHLVEGYSSRGRGDPSGCSQARHLGAAPRLRLPCERQLRSSVELRGSMTC